jgi:hypothetical protein
MRFGLFAGLSIGVTLAACCFILGIGLGNCLAAVTLLGFAYSSISILLCTCAYTRETPLLLRTGNRLGGGFTLGFLGLHLVLSAADKLSHQYALSFPLAALGFAIFAAVWVFVSTRLISAIRSY